MSTETESEFGTASGAEQAVFEALRALPDGYHVVRHPEGLTVKSQNMAYSYEPDLMISDPEGRKLMVEVKRPVSMSWSNMARFVQIDRSARDAGAAFLVLVPGSGDATPQAQVPEFNAVNIAYANDEPGMTQAVIEALDELPPARAKDARYWEDEPRISPSA